MKTIAIVGGSGFLGGHAVAALERHGYAIRVLSRRTGFDARQLAPEALAGVDAVVNLAGIKREDRSQSFQDVHVNLVRNLVGAMQVAGVRRLIHISVVVARPAPGLPYHDSKWKGEEVVRASSLDWTILRPGVIYGAGDDMLSHLAMMIGTAPVFPIVGDGRAPMRPVDARDVAAAIVAALENPTTGKTYDIVGPERLELREVVRRVADALNLPITIWPTPVSLMSLPVMLMERWMEQPLSTRAQLAMLAEGLDGNPDPARRDLGLITAPFKAERIRPILAEANRTVPFNLRLFSGRKPRAELSRNVFWTVLLLAIAGLTLVFLRVPDRWTGITAIMAPALMLGFFGPVRRRWKPSASHVAAGVGAGLLLCGVTLFMSWLFTTVWPNWESAARQLYSWSGGHSPFFLWPTLVLIVVAEELLWRGVVARFLIERCGKGAGILLAAAIYTGAHWASFNPLLLVAAFGCGVFWGWLFAVTDDLVAPTVSHLLWDVVFLFLTPVA